MRTIQRRWNWTGYKEKVLALDPIFYLPLDDLTVMAVDASRNHNNGTHIGVSPNQPGIGDNRLSVYYDGVNDWTECYSAGLDALFDPDECTMGIWIRLDAAAWTDSKNHRFIDWSGHLLNFFDQYKLGKTTTDNRLEFTYVGQNTTKQVLLSGISTLDWFHMAMSVTVSGAAMKAYYNGAQTGITQVNPVAWTQHLAANITCVGAFNGFGPTHPHQGYLAHAAVWNRILTANEIAQLAVIT